MQDVLVLFIVSILVISIIFILFYLYSKNLTKEFSENDFVIKLRNGKVSSTFQGGSTKCLPLIDDIVLIPINVQMTDIEIVNRTNEEEKNFDLKGVVSWNVNDPITAFSRLSWNPDEPNYAETIIKDMTESKLMTICVDKTISDIALNKKILMNLIMSELRDFFYSYSVRIDSVLITEINRI